MVKVKACKKCKTIYSGAKCPSCGSEEGKAEFKGKVVILNPEKSEIARNLKKDKKGEYAIKI